MLVGDQKTLEVMLKFYGHKVTVDACKSFYTMFSAYHGSTVGSEDGDLGVYLRRQEKTFPRYLRLYYPKIRGLIQ